MECAPLAMMGIKSVTVLVLLALIIIRISNVRLSMSEDFAINVTLGFLLELENVNLLMLYVEPRMRKREYVSLAGLDTYS